MNTDLEIINYGENVNVEFKSQEVRPESLARELCAFANTLGGVIYIGIDDDKKISGIKDDKNWIEWVANVARNSILPAIHPVIDIIKIDETPVCKIQVEKGKDKPYQTTHDGKYYLRVASTVRQATKEELSRLFQAAGLFHFDISPVVLATVKDLNPYKLEEYFKNNYALDIASMDVHERNNVLINSGLLIEIDEKLVPTVGGLLLFSDHADKYLPHAVLSTAVINGVEITESIIQKKEITGTLVDQVETALSFLNIFIPEPLVVKESARREDTIAIPRTILREVLVNAICHRDYSISTRKTQIYIYKDRIEVKNPGRLANTLTLEKIRFGNSAPRNLLLLKFLDNMHYIDGLGRGIPLIIRAMGERVLFAEDGDMFCVTLKYSE